MITLAAYWMGRDRSYPLEWTEEVRAHAPDLLRRVNGLLLTAGIVPEDSPLTGSPVASGWRPPSLNATVRGAAPRSRHMTGQAIDLYDPEGVLDDWCLAHPELLEAAELWQEHPGATKGWCHLQSIAPRSGHRVFYP